MLKADVRKPDIVSDSDEDRRKAIGEVVELARRAMGWTLDELAGQFEPRKDPRQIARWERGLERPHFDRLLAIPAPRFRGALVVAFAALMGAGVEIETQIRIKG